MTEAQLQAAIVDAARLQGWLVYHTYDSRRSAAGYPDLTLVRERVVFAEIKADKGRLSHAQQEWVIHLVNAGAEVHVWNPSSWRDGDVDAVLARRAA